MARLSWIAPHPDMMFAAPSSNVIYRITRVGTGFELTSESKDGTKAQLGWWDSVKAAKAEACRLAK